MDGGVRRGSDIAKHLPWRSRGADRTGLRIRSRCRWGGGCYRAINILKEDLDLTLTLLGCRHRSTRRVVSQCGTPVKYGG